ncbi:MAG: hypothetical protein FWE36_07090 [Erysipelotrichales bacterium]|nr:hypothetical protein [Erysipelotrichales bacterium]
MSWNKDESESRIKEILIDPIAVLEDNNCKGKRKLNYNEANYHSTVAIFVDIRNSSEMLMNGDKKVTARIIRAFTSETIGILRDCQLQNKEIGVRGDCVYYILRSYSKGLEDSLLDCALNIIEMVKILNKQIKTKDYNNINEIKVGIGISKADTLSFKAGSKIFQNKSLVWVGESVTKASNLSNMANKGNKAILVNKEFHNSLSPESKKKKDSEYSVKD